MPSLSELNDLVYGNLTNITITQHGQHFLTRCPFCGDSKLNKTKRRFNIHFKDDQNIFYQCWNCSTTGNIYTLYAHLNNVTNKQAWVYYNVYNANRIKRILSSKKKSKKKIKSLNTSNFNHILKDCVSLNSKPNGFVQKQYQNRLKLFVEQRNVSTKLFIAYQGEYVDRIIVPVIEDNNMIYFQARSTNPDIVPKYKNPMSDKQDIILNRNNFDRNQYICITEGILDAQSIGNQGTSMLGRSLSNDFFNSIKKLTNKGVIFVADNDETGIKSLIEYINKFKEIKKFFIMPSKYKHVKDINELLKYVKIEQMYDFIDKNSYNNVRASIMLRGF